jgi:serine/threonine protein kinase
MAHIISAGPFATEGERQAAKVLQELPPEWIVICNKILPKDDRSYEIDFIILGDRCVFLLDEKAWRGKIHGNDQLWVREDGFSLRSPLTKIDYIAKVVAGHLGWKVAPLRDAGYFVRSGILLSATTHLPQIHDSRAAHGIFLLADVCKRLQTLDSEGGSIVVGQMRPAIKKAFIDLSNRPQMPSKIGVYSIEDMSILRPGVRLFNGRMDGNPENVIQLMVYDLSKDPLDTDDLKNFYLRECTALQKLSSTGLTPRMNNPFPWSDDFLVMAIEPPAGKALSVYPLPETRDEFVSELLLAAACFKALDQIHAHSILHRAIGPDTLYVQSGQPAKVIFTNFYAARVGTESIALSLDALSLEDPYAAIELAIGYGYATPETDTFSLALVWLERLSGVSLTSIRANVESNIVFPQQRRWSSFLSVELAYMLTTLLQQCVIPEKGTTPPTAKDIAARLNDLAQRHKAMLQRNIIEEPLLDKRYKVIRFLGRGTMAQTYLASDTDFEALGVFALKQYNNPAEVLKQAAAEFDAMRKITSDYLPKIFDIYPPNCDVHIKMEYIPGPTLQQVEADFPWSLERWWSFAQDLLNAVDALEQKGLLHRDIKPANIILHETDNRPVLIDFGFAIPHGLASQVAGTPLYLPPETFSSPLSATVPLTSDRYAVGIVLFKALLGSMPFISTDGMQRQPISLEQISDEKTRRIAAVLLRVVSNDPLERPTSIMQMRQDLQTALLAVEEPPQIHELQEHTNPWVHDIRSLYRNSDIGNKNNRGLDTEFVKETYVPTALDEQLLPAIFAHKPAVVFLSGNPGDGKTAFLEKVQQELMRQQATFSRKDSSGWECKHNGHIYRSCYDASESYHDMSADQQLMEKLAGLEGTNKPSASVTVLIAINDGRLADYFTRYQAHFAWLAEGIELANDTNDVEQLNVWVVDLKKRAFVDFPNGEKDSVFREVLQRLVQADKWEVCNECAAQAICPMRNNALALRKGRVVQRVEYLFLLSHLRRQRHTTMRDLRSALSYMITGNKSCQQVHEARHGTEAGASLITLAYWQSAFAPVERSDELLTDLMPFDPARFPQPHLDRFLHFHQAAKDASMRSTFFFDKNDLSPQRFQNEMEWIEACKRRLYFEGPKLTQGLQNASDTSLPNVSWLMLLPYQHSQLFLALLAEELSDQEMKELREKIALGILRSDDIMEDVPGKKLSVKVSASIEQQLVILKQLSLEDFELTVEYSAGATMVEQLPELVVLKHVSGTPRLEITLDLFELLLKMAEGLQPTAPEFKPLLEDLKLFKDVLLLEETRDLVLIENQHRVHLVTQHEGKIVRTRLEHNSKGE